MVRFSQALPAFPDVLRDQYRAGILVTAVTSNSPVAQAGLRPGDLVLELNNQPVPSTKAFQRQVNQCGAGASLRLRYFRDGEVTTTTVVAGKETYQRWHTFQVGLPWSGFVDPWPNPEFSLIVAGYHARGARLDLESPESRFLRKYQGSGGRGEAGAGVIGRDQWRAWLVLFGLGGHHVVLSQELVGSGVGS